jgi:hypothetical protein
MEMPLKFNVLQPDTITDATITDILENAAIDHEDNGGLYITAYRINFWLGVDPKRKLLVLYTYWPTLPDADELDILRFANQANTSKIMLQFSYNAELERFYGYYAHSFSVGLIQPQVLRLAQHFSSIFEDVVQEGIEEGVLVEPTDQPDDDADEADDPVTELTVH